MSYEQAHEAIASRLSPAALGHSERVAASAGQVAERYGVDADEARLAGLLHDWHRELSAEALVARARELGIDVTEVDEAVPYLLHGPVAQADLARALPGVSEAVRAAVGAHTYGTADMSALAMVLYIADVIEPARHQPGVDALRAAVGTADLTDLFAEAYAASLHHLIDKRRRIHPQTVATWNAIAAGARR